VFGFPNVPRRALAAAAAVSLAALGVGACGGSSASPGSSAGSSRVGKGGSTARSSTSGDRPTLVVYSAQGYDKDTVKAFQAATGIPTKLVDDSTGPLLARIAAERANPQWGLLWVDGDEAFAGLDRQGLLRKGLSAPALTPAGRSVTPADHSYVPTGLTIAGTLVYDSRAVKQPPSDFQQLLAPQWRGKVGMNNPAVSGPTFPFVAGRMAALGGVAQGEAYFRALKANGLHVFQTNPDTLHALQTGQIQVALIQSSAGIGAAVKTPSIKTAFLPTVTLLPGAIGVDAKAPPAVQREAQQFIDFVLSPPGQKAMQGGDPTGDSLYWPVVSSTAPLGPLPALSGIRYSRIDPTVWGPRESAINNFFTSSIAR